MPLFRLPDVVDAAHVWMRDVARQPNLGHEPAQPVLVSRVVDGEQLQRNRLTEPQIVSAIHLAHAPAPEKADNAVASGEDAAWRKARVAERDGAGKLVVGDRLRACRVRGTLQTQPGRSIGRQIARADRASRHARILQVFCAEVWLKPQT